MQALKCIALLLVLVIILIPAAFITFTIGKASQLVFGVIEVIDYELLEPLFNYLNTEFDKLK